MEQTTLNSTPTEDQEWKHKKGYTPLIVLTALLFGCAFNAGQYGGSTVSTCGDANASMMSSNAFDQVSLAPCPKTCPRDTIKIGCECWHPQTSLAVGSGGDANASMMSTNAFDQVSMIPCPDGNFIDGYDCYRAGPVCYCY